TVAAAYFKTNHPTLMFVHDRYPDAFGHDLGWGSTQYLAAIKNCDQVIGILRNGVEQAGLASNTLFIITADHGGHLRGHGSKDVRDMTIPWIAYSPGNLITGEIQAAVSTCDTAATAVHALGLKVDPQWDGKALVEIFASDKAVVAR
ncbi:MAG: alkaline phosphatase family protein, partial [Kiritimatiellota bacterium]|nr:alkaline phosphatase family protein [Kiritimatiellota bacterium]